MLRIRILGARALALAGVLLAGAASAAEVDKYLPDDSQFVLCVDVRQILDAKLTKTYALEKIKDGFKKSAEAERLFKGIGLDPLKDIHSITVAGVQPGAEHKRLVIVRGSFD